ncbi:MAG: hypothetical protein J1E43_01225 [Christensenellaceae bacterium]|nr:hypothetical protein [Christensenellaceae bacterium]
MKVFGTILLIMGIACALCGLYGFYAITQSQVDSVLGLSVDNAIAMMRAFGATRQLSLADQVTLFALENRMLLLISGLIAAAAGFCVHIVAKKQ